MDLYNLNKGSGIFIQIGAGAGDLDKRANYRDGFTEFIKKLPREHIKKIILVEPNPLNIPLLKECWKDYPESTIYEIGIVPKNYKNNTIDLYYCPLDAPHYQVASINKAHIQKHYGDNCELNKFIIPIKQLEQFINEVTTDEIELLSLDIEGIDAEIILDINFDNLKLKYLSFEHLHLGDKKNNVLKHLSNNKYKFLGSGVDYNGYDYLYINWNFYDDWYSQDQCNNLIELVKNINHLNGVFIEIGCWEGNSTVSITNSCYPNNLICNDTWIGNVAESKLTGVKHITETILETRNVYEIFINNMNNNTKKNYTIVKEDCIEWLKTFNEPVKFIHIDASNEYDSVVETIKLILPNMVRGGIICGNNFLHAHIGRTDLNGGVEKAVRELLPGFQNKENLWFWINHYN